ncbi:MULTISPECIES: hypothetical protein [unclassified Leisingera]|uniref:hypothetical protein n=1 Tax=unclassified Leisingera TaxID=2614906 RepID=UPI00031E6AA1|nr:MULTISPECIES: hypothetical protein [unclassified Leisingera]KIC22320.1 hypothetical protein RA23_19525 [Leisingera sp. ANG-S3]KIC53495.1 hypothetical protein RA22_09500 [Leisingera sp. ANG-S]KID07890.1 hypothetical protein GC1_17945 [Leisingera sp. ANG1]
MSSKTILAGLLALILSCVPALADGGGGGGSRDGMDSGGGQRSGLSSKATQAVVKTLTSGFERCGTLPQVYKFDCYRHTYKLAAQRLNGNQAYAEAYKALVLVEETLTTAVKQNLDPAQKPKRKGLNLYRAVKPAAVPQIKRQAESAMKKAETILLRSPSNKQEHYTRIAQAVNSNKVLLRSALLPGGMIRLAWSLLKTAVPA